MDQTAVRGERSTIVDVARAAAVSRQTVSNALNYPDRVHPATLARVRREIDRLDYRPARAAQTLRQQRAGAIALELPAQGPFGWNDVAHPFLRQLALAAPRHGCHLVPFVAQPAWPGLTGYDEISRRRLADAFILTDTRHGDPRPEWLAARSIPFSSFGRLHDHPEMTTWAEVDGQAGTRQAVEHLVGRGFDRIGYLGWPRGSVCGDERRRGWEAAVSEHGLAPAPERTCRQDLLEAAEAAAPLLDEVGRGGAVVCASDLLALGVQHSALLRGWRVGTDIAITGFDASPMALAYGITTLEQPLAAIADHTLSIVHDLLRDGTTPEHGALFTPTLIAGRSTGTDPEGTP